MRAKLPSLAKYPFNASLVRLAREAPVESHLSVVYCARATPARRVAFLRRRTGGQWWCCCFFSCHVETSGPTSKLIPTHNGTIKVDAFWNPFATGLGQMVRLVAQISRNWPTSKSRVLSWNLSLHLAPSLPRTISLGSGLFFFISSTFYLSDSSWVWHWFDFILWAIVCSLCCPLCLEFITSNWEKVYTDWNIAL